MDQYTPGAPGKHPFRRWGGVFDDEMEDCFKKISFYSR
jgi:hypothetical protein